MNKIIVEKNAIKKVAQKLCVKLTSLRFCLRYHSGLSQVKGLSQAVILEPQRVFARRHLEVSSFINTHMSYMLIINENLYSPLLIVPFIRADDGNFRHIGGCLIVVPKQCHHCIFFRLYFLFFFCLFIYLYLFQLIIEILTSNNLIDIYNCNIN